MTDKWEPWEVRHVDIPDMRLGPAESGRWHDVPGTDFQVMFVTGDPLGMLWVRRKGDPDKNIGSVIKRGRGRPPKVKDEPDAE